MMIFAPDDAPLDVDLVILPQVSLLSLASVMEPMRGANRVAGRPLFRWRLLSPGGVACASSSGLPLAVEGAFDPARAARAVIVLASFDYDRHGGAPLAAALRAAGRRGVALGGVEAGSWILARAGLLDGRRATTHWEDLEAFAAAHPAVDVRPDRFVVDGPRFTTGGASPALDMMLHLVRARAGYAIALDVASLFIYDQRPAEAPQPQVSLGRLGWREPRLREAVALMEEGIAEPVPVPALAARVGCSARRLEELFKDRLGVGPYAYWLTLRLNAARRMALETAAPMAEIAAASGFASASAFARAFRGRFGESPGEARRRADRGVGAR
ncbi:MAG: helix-turn-helix domain-containing protein [Pseudomonadota bacterium]